MLAATAYGLEMWAHALYRMTDEDTSLKSWVLSGALPDSEAGLKETTEEGSIFLT